jgi:hypothetical protein
MMTQRNWRVTAVLSSPIAGDPPYIDAILEHEMAQRQGKAMRLSRADKAPPLGSVHIPCLRGEWAGVRGIPRCSAPIVAPLTERHEHYAKRIAVEHAALLREDQRLVVATGNTWTKSYRLPNKVTQADRVCWFVGGAKRRNLKSLLDSVVSIGKDISQGYGRVSEWLIEEVEHDWSWFAELPEGRLLMRVLPWADELERCIGWRRWCGGYAPPYWHPDRFAEVALPC